MIHDVRKNPGLLKLDLYCKGIRLSESCSVEKNGGRQIMRTRAGLGSGLEVILPDGLYTNIPVVEDFALNSPYLLNRELDGSYLIYDESGPVAQVKLAPQPAWYDRETSSGRKMSRIGTLQGTYLAIYPAKVCDYWLEKPERVNCKFCSVGYCTRIFHTTNGEIVAGLEPSEKSIQAIDWITSVGAVPTVCIFRPLKGTDYENLPPPSTEEMIPVFRRMYEACMEKGLMIGVAPNIKVSLVLLPEEGRYFLDNGNRYYLTRAKHAILRPLFKAAVKRRFI